MPRRFWQTKTQVPAWIVGATFLKELSNDYPEVTDDLDELVLKLLELFPCKLAKRKDVADTAVREYVQEFFMVMAEAETIFRNVVLPKQSSSSQTSPSQSSSSQVKRKFDDTNDTQEPDPYFEV